MSKEKHSRSVALELDYVREVYDKIGFDLSYAEDPLKNTVNKFLDNLEPGSIIADIGCGDGRHLRNDKGFYSFGADCSIQQTQLVRQRCQEAILGSNLYLPLRTESVDGALSVGVIHHLSTKQRRIQALQELARVLRIGGRILITVRIRNPQHTQDVLMPWYDVIKEKKNKEDSILTQDSGEGDLGDESDDSISLPSSDDEDNQDIIAKINHSQRFFNSKQKLTTDKKSKSLDCDFQFSNAVPNSQHSVPMQVCYNFVRKAFRRLSSTGADCISNNTAMEMVDSAISTTPTEVYSHQLDPLESGATVWDDLIQKQVDDNYIELLNIDEQTNIPQDHQPKAIDEPKMWCHSVEKNPKPKPNLKRTKSKRLIRSLSDAFKTIPSLWSSKEVKSCSDLKGQTISLHDIAKEGKRNKQNLVRSRTTATCNSSFDAFQTLEDIREIEMSVTEAEKIIDSFLESSISKIETVPPEFHQPESQKISTVSNSNSANDYISLDDKYILQKQDYLSHFNKKFSSVDISSKYPITNNKCDYFRKNKKYPSVGQEFLNYSMDDEILTCLANDIFPESYKKRNKEYHDENSFGQNMTSNLYFSSEKTNSLENSDLSKLPFKSNLNDIKTKRSVQKHNKNYNNVPYHSQFTHQDEVLQANSTTSLHYELQNLANQQNNEQPQNCSDLSGNIEPINTTNQNRLKVNRKFSFRSSSGQNISSKRCDSIQNTFYRAPYLKPIGPFYDAEPDDNSFLSTYTSMPELYNLSEFYQEYCIYKCTSKSRTSWDLFYNSIENVTDFPTSLKEGNNGDMHSKNSKRHNRDIRSASKKRKERQRSETSAVSRNKFGKSRVTSTLDSEISNDCVCNAFENFENQFNLPKTSIFSEPEDTDVDKTSLLFNKNTESTSELNFINAEMAIIPNRNSLDERSNSRLKEFAMASKQIPTIPEFSNINNERAMSCLEKPVLRSITCKDTSSNKSFELEKSINPEENHYSTFENLFLTSKNSVDNSIEQASDQSTKFKRLKRQSEDLTAYSRMGTVGRKFSLNMSETMYIQHIDKKCEVCLQLANDNLHNFKHSIQENNATESLYQDKSNSKISELGKIINKDNVQTKTSSNSQSSNLPEVDHNSVSNDYFDSEIGSHTTFKDYISETDYSEKHANRNKFDSQIQTGAKPKHSSFINNHPLQKVASEEEYFLNSGAFSSESKGSNKLRSKLANHSKFPYENSTQTAQNRDIESTPQNINYSYGHVHEEGATVTMHRYHHLFEQDELDDLIENFVDDLHILETFKDQFHWCIIAEKVRVWTI